MLVICFYILELFTPELVYLLAFLLMNLVLLAKLPAITWVSYDQDNYFLGLLALWEWVTTRSPVSLNQIVGHC